MIRKVIVKRFKKFQHLECELQERALIVGPNNSGKTTLLQALASWAEFGEILLARGEQSESQEIQDFGPVEVEIAGLRTLALSRFEELWHSQNTKEAISIGVTTDEWDVSFELEYRDAGSADLRPSEGTTFEDLRTYARTPLKALYIPSLSGLDVNEPEYGESVLTARLAQGKGGMVLRNLVQAASKDDAKWVILQNTVQSLFGYELAPPSGSDPITARYRHSAEDQWYDMVNGAAGFLQTVLVQAALLNSSATLFLVDEPDAHLHALLKERIYRIIREHCDQNQCQVLIATHSGRLIDEAAREQGEKLFLVTEEGLNRVDQNEAKTLLKIPGEHIVLAETTYFALYLEGKSDLDILREWANVLNHGARRVLDSPFWIATAEMENRSFAKKHYSALRAQVPSLRALEVRDRNGSEGPQWENLDRGVLRIEEGHGRTPSGMKLAYWSRYETENYLIYPASIERFVTQISGKDEMAKATAYMKQYLPGVLFEDPFETTTTDRDKGKKVIAEILNAAGVKLAESEYYKLAAAMLPNEIHPDVITVLDTIETQSPNLDA